MPTGLFLFFFLANQIQNVHVRRSFLLKSQDLYRTKVVLVCISCTLSSQNYCDNLRMRAERDPSRTGRLFPALLTPSPTAFIPGFSQ